METASPISEPSAEALEAAIDILWPLYTDDKVPKIEFARKSHECRRIALALDRFREAAANATLISASPDLAEALHNTLALLKAFVTRDDDIARVTLEQAEAALAKARYRLVPPTTLPNVDSTELPRLGPRHFEALAEIARYRDRGMRHCWRVAAAKKLMAHGFVAYEPGSTIYWDITEAGRAALRANLRRFPTRNVRAGAGGPADA